MNTITFNQVALNPVAQPDNQIWVTSAQLANALGYARPDSVNKIFERNSDEFTDQMSRYVNLTYRNKNNELDNNNFRIFSLRGCHLITMFAKTEVAKQFHKWVLDLIEQQMQNSQYHQVSVMQQYCTMQMLANLNLPDADEVMPYVH